MIESRVIRAVKTELPPCCLQILQGKYVLVGTYHLDKASGKRTGSLDVFDQDLQLVSSQKTYGAILDLKLSKADERIVATAHSTGNIILWRVTVEDKETKTGGIALHQIINMQIFDVDTLVTSLHFSPLDPRILLVTNTLGGSAIVDILDENVTFTCNSVVDRYQSQQCETYEVQGSLEPAIGCEPAEFLEGHSLECWTGEFGQLSPLQSVVFTGGDDATIMAHDLRSKETIWSNNRLHEAGVVAIKSSSSTFRNSRPTSIITGSYDDKIRAVDLRMLGSSLYPGKNTPVVKTSDSNLGGGVWRFSECPPALHTATVSSDSYLDRLLVCCMYDGAKVVELHEEEQMMFEVKSYLKKGHDSMCYGGDWSENFAVTCSFYDNSLQMWNP